MPHTHGSPDNEAEWLEMLLGRGKGDPDVYPIPCYHNDFRIRPAAKQNHYYIGTDKPNIYHIYENLHWSEKEKLMNNTSTKPRPPREWGDNDAASPEEAGWSDLYE